MSEFITPPPPTNPGEQWEHPVTGIVYEWNGERWVVLSNNHGHDDTYVNRAGDTMNGPLVLAGTPRIGQEAANRAYVDNEIDEVKVGIAGILIEKGSARNYIITSVNGSGAFAKGALSLNGANPERITLLSFNALDIGGQGSRVPEVGDVIELDRTQDGLAYRFLVRAVPAGTENISVAPAGGTLATFGTNEAITAYVYPQQNPGVSQPELDAAMDLKVSKSGDEMTGSLSIKDSNIKVNNGHVHILNGSTFGSTDSVPFVIARKSSDSGSMCRWYIDGKDALKIGGDARVTYLRGVDFQGPPHTGGNTTINIQNQAPPSWDKASDFTLNIDLKKENTFHNKFSITGNSGDWLWYSSGNTNELQIDNLKNFKIKSGVSDWSSETALKYGNNLSGNNLNSMSPLPREAFDNVLFDYNKGKYNAINVNRANLTTARNPGIYVKSNNPATGYDIVVADSQGQDKIWIQSEGYSSGRPYIAVGTEKEPGFASSNEMLTTIEQACAPARMAWKNTSSGTPSNAYFYYSTLSMRLSYVPKLGGKIRNNNIKWNLQPNTYFTIWSFDLTDYTWEIIKAGHVTEIEYTSYGIQCMHDETVSTRQIISNETCYITIGGFIC